MVRRDLRQLVSAAGNLRDHPPGTLAYPLAFTAGQYCRYHLSALHPDEIEKRAPGFAATGTGSCEPLSVRAFPLPASSALHSLRKILCAAPAQTGHPGYTPAA